MAAHRFFFASSVDSVCSIVLSVVIGWTSVSFAHHGVAGIGVAGLEGPGAPIEAATSATLPDGKVLLYLKLDRADYEKFDPDPSNPESDFANFWIGGIGYGASHRGSLRIFSFLTTRRLMSQEALRPEDSRIFRWSDS